MKHFLIAFSCLALVATQAQAGESGFVSLFDGKSLKGWTESDGESSFAVRDGAIVAQGNPKGHLFYAGNVNGAVFTDFELKLDVKTTPGANGGVYFHTKHQADGWPKQGFECQVNATHSDRIKTGSLYAVKNVMDDAPHKDNEWFACHIIVKGEKVTIRVDVKTVLDWEQPEEFRKRPAGDRKIQPGTFAFQAHDPKSVVYFKNVRVKVLE